MCTSCVLTCPCPSLSRRASGRWSCVHLEGWGTGAIFKRAVFKGIIDSNPVEIANQDDDSRPSAVATKAKRQHFDWDERTLADILDTAARLDERPEARTRYLPILATLAYTGLRSGEALALRWQDVNLDEGTLTVNASSSRKRERTTPKTISSNRVIDIPPMLVTILAAHALRAYETGKADPEHFVFAAKGGTEPMSYWNVRARGWAKVVHMLELKGVTLHELHHASVSLMHAAGVPDAEIAAHHGHQNAETTRKLYVHTFGRSRRAVAAYDVIAGEAV